MADFDLAAWDFKEEFSGHEAAALILGLEPTEVSKMRVEPVAARLERDFYKAISKLHRAYAGTGNWAGLCRRDPDDPIPLDMIPEIAVELTTQARLVAEWEAAEAGTDKQEPEILLYSTKLKELEKDAFVSRGIELFDTPQSVNLATGLVFDYFDEVRKVVELAKSDIFFVDPYLDADFVARFLPMVAQGTTVRLLGREKLPSLIPAATLFQQQSGIKIEVRSASGFHDRYLFIDQAVCYQSGASFKDGAKKAPTTLTQITDAFQAVLNTYESLWAGAIVHV